MECYTQHEPLEVEELAASSWADSRQLRNYFKLISIRKAPGAYVASGQHLRYRAGSVFLLGQITNELAFTTVYHLNKLFNKLCDTTPSDYHCHLLALPVASV